MTLPKMLARSLACLLLFAAANAEAQAPGPRADEPRLRYGASMATGFGFFSDPNQSFAWHVDLHGRIGAQVNDLFAVYYQGSLLVGVTIAVFDSSMWLPLHTSAAIAEVTLGNGFQIGAGPAFAIGSGVDALVVGGGIAGRIGWTFGGFGEGTRQGFSIAIQPNGGWFASSDGGYWNLTLALGWDSF